MKTQKTNTILVFQCTSKQMYVCGVHNTAVRSCDFKALVELALRQLSQRISVLNGLMRPNFPIRCQEAACFSLFSEPY